MPLIEEFSRLGGSDADSDLDAVLVLRVLLADSLEDVVLPADLRQFVELGGSRVNVSAEDLADLEIRTHSDRLFCDWMFSSLRGAAGFT